MLPRGGARIAYLDEHDTDAGVSCCRDFAPPVGLLRKTAHEWTRTANGHEENTLTADGRRFTRIKDRNGDAVERCLACEADGRNRQFRGEQGQIAHQGLRSTHALCCDLTLWIYPEVKRHALYLVCSRALMV